MDKTLGIDTYVEYLQNVTFVRDVSVANVRNASVMLAVDGKRAGTHLNRRRKASVGHGTYQADAELKVTTIDGHVHVLHVEQKKAPLTRETLHRVAAQFSGNERSFVLFAGYVPAPIAAELTAREINFIDRSGNCYLRLGTGFVAQIQGRPSTRPEGEKALRSASVRVLLALAAAPTLLAAPTREIAAHAGGVSPQTVADVIDLLRRRNIVSGQRQRKWQAGAAKLLLDLLVHVWPACATSLTVQRYRTRSQRADEIEATLTPQLNALGEWRWSGGIAVGKLTDALTSNEGWIYVEQRPTKLPRFEGMVPDPQGNIRLLSSPGKAAFASVAASDEPTPRTPAYATQHTVHPSLVYLDALVSTDARTNEAARYLLPMIEVR